MADNIDPQQIDTLNENLKALIETMGGVAAKGPGVSKSLGEMAGLGKNANAALGILGSSAAAVGGALYNGEKGAKVFSSAIENASNALTLLVLAIPGLGIAAKVAAVAANLFAKGLNAASKQGDALYKTYQDLQKSGATASDGITGVFNNMQKFGYGIEELDKMTKLVTENSQTLAKFSLTAADGTSAFASEMQGLVRDKGLKVLGKMPDEINAAGAAYIKQSVAAGRSQKDIGDNLGVSTKQYIMDLDRLQRLTGTSADQLQKQQDDAMSEDAYNDVMSDLKARADTGDANATAQIKKITTTMASLSPEMQKEFQKSIGGDISAQQKLMMRMPTLMKNVMDESVGVGQTMNDAKKDITTYVDTMGKSYRLNSEGMREYGGTLRSAREEITQFSNWEEREAAAAKGIKVEDAATDSLAKINLEQMNSRDALQSFVQLGVAPATRAMAALAKGTSVATSMLPGAGPAGENSVAGKLDAMSKAGGKVVPTGAGAGLAGAVGQQVVGSSEARAKAEGYYGKKMSDTEFSSLIKATHAEAGAGKKASQEEQAMIMASVLNRARTDQGGIMGALTAKNQFQSVTGTAADGHRASNNYLQGPDKDRLKSIEGATAYLDKISKEQKNFTAASSAAYGPGTNIGYRDKMLAGGGQVIGGSVFQTGMPAGSKSNANDKTTLASDSYKNQLSDLNKEAQAARDKLAATTAGPLTGYQSQLSGLNPSKTLPEKTDATQTVANLPVAGDDKHADLLSQILGSLDNLNHSNQQIASSTKKSVQLQS